MKMSSAWLGLIAVACRWGGPEGDPSDLFGPWTPAPTVEQPGTAGAVGTEGGVEADGASEDAAPSEPTATGEAGDPTGIDEAGPDVQGGVVPFGSGGAEGVADDGDGARPDEAVDGGFPPPPPAPQTCDAPADLLCDPVSNAGCLPLTQCVVDPNASMAATYCVVASLSLDAACTQDLLSTSCPPQHTCVAGQCREYCYCDADCDDGAPCTDPSGQGGSDAFELCALEP